MIEVGRAATTTCCCRPTSPTGTASSTSSSRCGACSASTSSPPADGRFDDDPTLGPPRGRAPRAAGPRQLGRLRGRRAGHPRPAGERRRGPHPRRSPRRAPRRRRCPGWTSCGLSHTFPTPTDLAEADLDGVGLTGARAGPCRSFAAPCGTARSASTGACRSTSWSPRSSPCPGSATGPPSTWPCASASPTPCRRPRPPQGAGRARTNRRRALAPVAGARGDTPVAGRLRRAPGRVGSSTRRPGGSAGSGRRTNSSSTLASSIRLQEQRAHGLGHHLERLAHRRERRARRTRPPRCRRSRSPRRRRARAVPRACSVSSAPDLAIGSFATKTPSSAGVAPQQRLHRPRAATPG